MKYSTTLLAFCGLLVAPTMAAERDLFGMSKLAFGCSEAQIMDGSCKDACPCNCGDGFGVLVDPTPNRDCDEPTCMDPVLAYQLVAIQKKADCITTCVKSRGGGGDSSSDSGDAKKQRKPLPDFGSGKSDESSDGSGSKSGSGSKKKKYFKKSGSSKSGSKKDLSFKTKCKVDSECPQIRCFAPPCDPVVCVRGYCLQMPLNKDDGSSDSKDSKSKKSKYLRTGGKKVKICHKTGRDSKPFKLMEVSASAVQKYVEEFGDCFPDSELPGSRGKIFLDKQCGTVGWDGKPCDKYGKPKKKSNSSRSGKDKKSSRSGKDKKGSGSGSKDSKSYKPKKKDYTFCTQDAKQCADGSYVSRVAPSCEFEKCPGDKDSRSGKSRSGKSSKDSKSGKSRSGKSSKDSKSGKSRSGKSSKDSRSRKDGKVSICKRTKDKSNPFKLADVSVESAAKYLSKGGCYPGDAVVGRRGKIFVDETCDVVDREGSRCSEDGKPKPKTDKDQGIKVQICQKVFDGDKPYVPRKIFKRDLIKHMSKHDDCMPGDDLPKSKGKAILNSDCDVVGKKPKKDSNSKSKSDSKDSKSGKSKSGKGKPKKVEICHRTGSDKNPFVLIEISENAVQQHFSKHGDCYPGDPLPGSRGRVFLDDDCDIVGRDFVRCGTDGSPKPEAPKKPDLGVKVKVCQRVFDGVLPYVPRYIPEKKLPRHMRMHDDCMPNDDVPGSNGDEYLDDECAVKKRKPGKKPKNSGSSSSRSKKSKKKKNSSKDSGSNSKSSKDKKKKNSSKDSGSKTKSSKDKSSKSGKDKGLKVKVCQRIFDGDKPFAPRLMPKPDVPSYKDSHDCSMPFDDVPDNDDEYLDEDCNVVKKKNGKKPKKSGSSSSSRSKKSKKKKNSSKDSGSNSKSSKDKKKKNSSKDSKIKSSKDKSSKSGKDKGLKVKVCKRVGGKRFTPVLMPEPDVPSYKDTHDCGMPFDDVPDTDDEYLDDDCVVVKKKGGKKPKKSGSTSSSRSKNSKKKKNSSKDSGSNSKSSKDKKKKNSSKDSGSNSKSSKDKSSKSGKDKGLKVKVCKRVPGGGKQFTPVVMPEPDVPSYKDTHDCSMPFDDVPDTDDEYLDDDCVVVKKKGGKKPKKSGSSSSSRSKNSKKKKNSSKDSGSNSKSSKDKKKKNSSKDSGSNSKSSKDKSTKSTKDKGVKVKVCQRVPDGTKPFEPVLMPEIDVPSYKDSHSDCSMPFDDVPDTDDEYLDDDCNIIKREPGDISFSYCTESEIRGGSCVDLCKCPCANGPTMGVLVVAPSGEMTCMDSVDAYEHTVMEKDMGCQAVCPIDKPEPEIIVEPEIEVEEKPEPKAPKSPPTGSPTAGPTSSPTASPTNGPTSSPTAAPTAAPTTAPTAEPTDAPTTSPVESWISEEHESQGCETAFAYHQASGTCFSDLGLGINRWGWSIGPISPDSSVKHEYEIYAGAAGCDTDKGTKVGTLEFTYDGSQAHAKYMADGNYIFEETHFYLGTKSVPHDDNGNPTVAPGQYTAVHDVCENSKVDNIVFDLTPAWGDIYIIAHAVSCDDWRRE
ncbi:expressed unknown protein [Seminavis robusta]|uniref:Uncharacterized protein n=1 Tax=Seminavis robusta TaxID=568900 RepID=A0A9N8HCW2_9STRA|nr:expressed unknown protein [Seminavis robusta]|eukprot:Sro398_g134670.1 n/a (1544) ;mRNA; f:25692-30420